MKIGIIGPGAMGCLFAVFLKEAGEEVWLIDHNSARAARIAKTGIRVESISGARQVKVNVIVSAKEAGVCELILICVKSYDTEKAIRENLSLIGDSSYVLTLQNGLGNMEIISAAAGEEKIFGGTTSQGATLLGDGYIRHAGRGETAIGAANAETNASNPKLKKIREIFEKAGFETKVVDNVHNFIWSKLIINVGINALTAITRLKNGRLVEISHTKKIMAQAVSEAVAAARRRGIVLSYADPLEKVKAVCRATTGNTSSMLQDVLKGKKTEIDFINGAIVKEAKKLGIDVPVNILLTELVKAIEETYGGYENADSRRED